MFEYSGKVLTTKVPFSCSDGDIVQLPKSFVNL